MQLKGMVIDWMEEISRGLDDPESRPAGATDPHYNLSEKVSMSRDQGMFVYHVPDDQLGQGSSFGNARAWAETKGNNDMLNLFSIETGHRVLGGMSITYLLPFHDLSLFGRPVTRHSEQQHDTYARAMPSAAGTVHLHPAYQQREYMLGDGLHVLETFFMPRTGMDDPAAAHTVVSLRNQTPHPIEITVVGSIDLRGYTPRDIIAEYDEEHGALVAWNESQPEWVRLFGANKQPDRYWATADEEEAYSPGHPLPNCIEASGDMLGALQFNLTLLPRQHYKLRFTAAFCPEGKPQAKKAFAQVNGNADSLNQTISHFREALETSVIETPDTLLTQGVQWSKACMLRPLSTYKVGDATTNDPGDSCNLVGRDVAWYTHGCDLMWPEKSCGMLRILANHQREDGLIPEYIDGNSGEAVYHDFNINDNTPLFMMAAAHHVRTSGHGSCLDELYPPAKRAGELILRQIGDRGLIWCTADGLGAKGICGWRNVLENEQITGAVTEVNSECHAALNDLAELAELAGEPAEAQRYRNEASRLREAINRHLISPRTGLYMRNIDLEGRAYTQATVDMAFPLICGVADKATREAVSLRLFTPDFMTPGGIRVLPEENPRYDPSENAGCLGGVWPGATWWFAMGCIDTNSTIMAESLHRSYNYYIRDPKTFNTVPGQFNEWSDGQTLVNRGMRLSPWSPPRFLWVSVEGMMGVKFKPNGIAINPNMAPDWRWLQMINLPYHDRRVSCFVARLDDGLHVYTCHPFETDMVREEYDKELPEAIDTLTVGLTASSFQRGDEVVICLGSSRDQLILGPLLTHRALKTSRDYEVWRMNSIETEWKNLGVISGEQLQRLSVGIEPKGFAIYRFIAQ